MLGSNETLERLKKNGLLDFILHLATVGRYRAIFATPKYFFISKRTQARLFNGQILKLPKQSLGIGKELALYGIHEPIATKLYEDMLEPGERIFEAGANIGYYVSVAEAKLSSNVQFLAIEPDSDVFGTLAENVASISHRIRMKLIAASDKPGEVTFYRSKSSNLGSIRKSRRTDDRAITVPTATIDALCTEFKFDPSVLRMDIEGAEIFALRGARATLSRCKPKLFIELHPTLMSGDEVREVIDILRSNGYRKVTIVDRSYDQPSALRFLERAKPKSLTIDELQTFVAKRHVTALGLFARSSEAGN